MLDEALKHVAVLGAGGKMGSGISLLLLQEMAFQEARTRGGVGTGEYTLVLIDAQEKALLPLKKYLRTQLLRFAEKSINSLRVFFSGSPHLISNEEIIRTFVEGALDSVRLETNVLEAKDCRLIFEAIVEDCTVKAKVFAEIDRAGGRSSFFFTNTSSIPIGEIGEKSGVGARLIGYHFYNPPPVQRLLEIIPSEQSDPELIACAEALAARLGKIVVLSRDVAGFIGNGHFVREVDFACRKVYELAQQYTMDAAVWMVNRVTQEFLIRPMGIFQLLDYVGIDVMHKVMGIMERDLGSSFESGLIEKMISGHVFGGQKSDGTQKDGFFKYDGGRIAGIWCNGKYLQIPKDHLGDPPAGWVSWKEMQKRKDRETVLGTYFHNLFATDTLGAKLAREFLLHSRDAARELVEGRVAGSMEDVNIVLINGFYHVYGAENHWLPAEQSIKG